jgi:hypothetical protein
MMPGPLRARSTRRAACRRPDSARFGPLDGQLDGDLSVVAGVRPHVIDDLVLRSRELNEPALPDSRRAYA